MPDLPLHDRPSHDKRLNELRLNERQLSELVAALHSLLPADNPATQAQLQGLLRQWSEHPDRSLAELLRLQTLEYPSVELQSLSDQATLHVNTPVRPPHPGNSTQFSPKQFELTFDSEAGNGNDAGKGQNNATVQSVPSSGKPDDAELLRRLQISVRSRYEFVRPLDKGGLGVVEVAKDRELDREVALKRIRPDKANSPVYRSKFIREAEVTGNLEHPALCQFMVWESTNVASPITRCG